MKTRFGFVSNSSTSSYFIVIPANVHKKILKSFTKKEQEILKDLALRTIRFMGKEVKIFAYSGFDEGDPMEPLLKEGSSAWKDDSEGGTSDTLTKWLGVVKEHPETIYETGDE